MGNVVRFKHFKHPTETGLCEMLEEWINGETDHIHWIPEFNVIEGSDGKWHAFVKYEEVEGD